MFHSIKPLKCKTTCMENNYPNFPLPSSLRFNEVSRATMHSHFHYNVTLTLYCITSMYDSPPNRVGLGLNTHAIIGNNKKTHKLILIN